MKLTRGEIVRRLRTNGVMSYCRPPDAETVIGLGLRLELGLGVGYKLVLGLGSYINIQY